MPQFNRMRQLLCVDRDNGVNNHTGSLPIDGEHPDSGYLRITFYFYEEVETVMIGSIDGLTGKMHFIHFVMSVYKSMFNRSMKALAVHLQDSPHENQRASLWYNVYDNSQPFPHLWRASCC